MLCPDLISRCNPDPGSVNPTFGLSTVAICHQSDRHIINDGFKSFPSGHASSAVYSERPKRMYCTDSLQCPLPVSPFYPYISPESCICLTHGDTRYIYSKRKVAEVSGLIFASGQGLGCYFPVVRSHTRRHLADYGLPTQVLLFMIQVRRLTRVSLSQDHWHDVVAGSLLGLVTAYFVYRQYFRSLTSRVSHLPYSPRPRRRDPTPGLPV
jgi:diacylglycerol diphosphate phosphatase/phosphatidate phosphatase